MSLLPVRVLKFGSSVLSGPRRLPAAVDEVYRELREARRVVAVVSAFAGATDRLLGRARRIAREPEPRALAAYLATGEMRAAALFALALERAGVAAEVVDPLRASLRVRGGPLDGEPRALEGGTLERVLGSGAVAVVPGFFGAGDDGATALLGRGGSDLSALFLADALGGSCRLVKDVDGVFDADPAAGGARRFARLSWRRALALGGGVVQEKALRFALERRLTFAVGALGSLAPTEIGRGPSVLAGEETPRRPLRVALLGLGTVGLGVWRALARHRELFDVRAILVRDLAKARAADVPRELLTGDARAALAGPLYLAIEVAGGVDAAGAWIEELLVRGVDVVSANKELLARRGPFLLELARASGAELRAGAAVGGAVPMLEVVRQLAARGEIVRLEGVLNGTCNFVLAELGRGASFPAALRAARERGLAEADPARDTHGHDAAEKLELLARVAFGSELAARAVWRERCGIAHLAASEVHTAEVAGTPVRLVASLARTRSGIEARVGPRALAAAHPLSLLVGAGNALVIETAGGERAVLRGAGAGRWPTATAVLGDALAIERRRRTDPHAQRSVGAAAAGRSAP